MAEDFKKVVFCELAQQHLTYVKQLGRGTFGDVMLVKSPENQEFAVKIVKKEYSWLMEEKEWPHLVHQNILPVKRVIKLKDEAGTLFVMPSLPNSLHDIVASAEFPEDKRALLRSKRWFKDVLSGIAYMHSKQLCHLDIKSDNILVDSRDRAVVCDFSGLNTTKYLINR